MSKPCKTYTDIQRSHLTINKTGKPRVYRESRPEELERGRVRRAIEDKMLEFELNDDPLFLRD